MAAVSQQPITLAPGDPPVPCVAHGHLHSYVHIICPHKDKHEIKNPN